MVSRCILTTVPTRYFLCSQTYLHIIIFGTNKRDGFAWNIHSSRVSCGCKDKPPPFDHSFGIFINVISSFLFYLSSTFICPQPGVKRERESILERRNCKTINYSSRQNGSVINKGAQANISNNFCWKIRSLLFWQNSRQECHFNSDYYYCFSRGLISSEPIPTPSPPPRLLPSFSLCNHGNPLPPPKVGQLTTLGDVIRAAPLSQQLKTRREGSSRLHVLPFRVLVPLLYQIWLSQGNRKGKDLSCFPSLSFSSSLPPQDPEYLACENSSGCFKM